MSEIEEMITDLVKTYKVIREVRVGKFRYKMQAGIGAHREQHRRCPGMKGRRTEGRSGGEM